VGYKIQDRKLTDDTGIIAFVSKKQDESNQNVHIELVSKYNEGEVVDIQTERFLL
jgi:hypothetical protein